MEGAHQKLLVFTGRDDIEEEKINTSMPHESSSSNKLVTKLWLQISIFIFFILSGQIVTTILGKVYYNYGGQSQWMASLVAFAGFPLLFPLIIFSNIYSSNTKNINANNQLQPSSFVPASVCVCLGLLLAANSLLNAVGLRYLPASTFSLISSTQLAFNGLFSFLLNGHKITPAILISVLLLTFSSVLVVIQEGEDKLSEKKDLISQLPGSLIGYGATILGAAGSGLLFSLTELVFRKNKGTCFRVVMHMSIYQSLVATLAGLTGLFMSGDWKTLENEMGEYRLGKVAYVMYLILGAVYSQAATLGSIGLIFKVTSLFSNVIYVLGVPLTQLSVVLVLHDSMSSLKLVSLFLGLLGFGSFLYQQYLDGLKANAADESTLNL